jgi:alpha-beta hydrolase superfamily lysophospholipase
MNDDDFYTDKFTLEKENLSLFYRTNSNPNKEVNYHFIILHGVSDYHKRFLEISKQLNKNNIQDSFYTWLDLRGHGHSSGKRGYIDRFELFNKDTTSFINHLVDKSLIKKEKVIIISQSLGGLISLNLALNNPLDLKAKIAGLILSNPIIKIKESFFSNMSKLTSHGAKLIPILKIKQNFSGFDLTRDKKKALEYQLDPLINKSLTGHLLLEVIQASEAIRNQSYYLDIPTLILLSKKDILCSYEFTEIFYKGISSNKKHLINYKNSYHDLFNDINKDKVFSDAAKWIKSTIS